MTTTFVYAFGFASSIELEELQHRLNGRGPWLWHLVRDASSGRAHLSASFIDQQIGLLMIGPGRGGKVWTDEDEHHYFAGVAFVSGSPDARADAELVELHRALVTLLFQATGALALLELKVGASPMKSVPAACPKPARRPPSSTARMPRPRRLH